MNYDQLRLNRFLQKQPQQDEQTKGSTFNVLYPAPKRNSVQPSTKGRVPGNEEDDGAPNILTGTVITSCFIQTTALPSRVEMEGNNITFYDDTFEQGGEVIGDTSKLVFTHDLNSGEGFIMEKRASIHNTYDNVLSWYATPAKEGSVNYLYIGKDGRDSLTADISYIEISANIDTSLPLPSSRGAYNGVLSLVMYQNGVNSQGVVQLINHANIDSTKTGVSVIIQAAGDGSSADSGTAIMQYINNSTSVAGGSLGVNKTGVFADLPTSSAGLPVGYLWNDGGTVKIVI